MRIEGVRPEEADDYARRVFRAQAEKRGAPLANHLVHARRPTIFRGVRAMWQGLDVSDELFARLREFYTDSQIMELTETVAWENASSKFNRAPRIPSQGLWKRKGG